MICQPGQIVQRLRHQRVVREDFACTRKDVFTAKQRREAHEHLGSLGSFAQSALPSEVAQGGHVFVRQCIDHSLMQSRVKRSDAESCQNTLNQADVGKVDDQAMEARDTQTLERQFGCFQIGFQASVTVNFGAQLQLLACRVRTFRASVQHRATVAETGDAISVEQVSINASHLRRGIRTETQRAATELVHELEGLEPQCVPRSGQQRLQVLQHGRHHEFIPVAASRIEPDPTQLFHATRLRRQDVSDVLWQQPSRRHKKTCGG